MKYLFLEFYKLKRRKIFLTVFLLLAAELLWSSVGFHTDSFMKIIKISKSPSWEYMLRVLSQMECLFFPVMIAVVVSRINDMEHKENTWKLLMSDGESIKTIYRSKFLCILIIIVAAEAVEILYLILWGHSNHVAEPFPAAIYFNFFAGSIMVSIGIIAIQQWISMAVQNQLVAMSVGMLGAFLGFLSPLLPSAAQNLIIWGYYWKLSPADFIVKSVNETPAIVAHSINMVPVLIMFVIGILIYFIGRHNLDRIH